MVKTDIISATNANRLFWLGRYEQRVYITLHILRKCYDKMIDGSPEDYLSFWQKLDAGQSYSSEEEFTLGMMYDESNPCSIISALHRAMDNAMMLRENITSETLSYLEMSLSFMKTAKRDNITNITSLQQITDWSLAFWGSAEQRIYNNKVLNIMHIGQNIENIDMLLRFNYPFERILVSFNALKKIFTTCNGLIDTQVLSHMEDLLTEEKFCASDTKGTLLKLCNILVRV